MIDPCPDCDKARGSGIADKTHWFTGDRKAVLNFRTDRYPVEISSERALDAGQRTPMTLNVLGLARLAVGDRRGAAAAFRESLRLDPQQPDDARTLSEMGKGGPSG